MISEASLRWAMRYTRFPTQEAQNITMTSAMGLVVIQLPSHQNTTRQQGAHQAERLPPDANLPLHLIPLPVLPPAPF